jgi:hypothetical protein
MPDPLEKRLIRFDWLKLKDLHDDWTVFKVQKFRQIIPMKSKSINLQTLQLQSSAKWNHSILAIELLLRFILILQIDHKVDKLMILPLMVFDILLISFGNITDSNNGYKIVTEALMIYLYQYFAGQVHIFYVFTHHLVFNVARGKFNYCLFLIMNIMIAACVIGRYNLQFQLYTYQTK